jgi:hypothetical protein
MTEGKAASADFRPDDMGVAAAGRRSGAARRARMVERLDAVVGSLG